MLRACKSDCLIQFLPPNGTFMLEQSDSLVVSEVNNLSLIGHGAHLIFDNRGDCPFLLASNCSNIFITNMTLDAQRPPFSYGVVDHNTDDNRVNLRVNVSQYSFNKEKYPWIKSIGAMHEVVPALDSSLDGFRTEPLAGGLDWLFRIRNSSDALQLRVDKVQ